MPYRRSYRNRGAPRTTRRTSRRRYSAKKSYSRPTTRTKKIYRRTSKKRILNITSKKKRDDMLILTNVLPDRSRPTTYSSSFAQISGGVVASEEYTFLWCATARSNLLGTSPPVTPDDAATRTATTCFMRGLKEVCELQVTTGLPWQWRRIIFAMRGTTPTFNVGGNFYLANLTSNGYRRTVNEIFGAGKTQFYHLLFAGAQGTDWNDPLIAKIDTVRVDLKYDRTRTIASGNEQGMIRAYRHWHPLNKNLVYDDDQNGGDNDPYLFSVSDKRGMGDLMVVDIFRPRGGSTTNDLLTFKPQATLYWHEK
uniref:Capsid protein n=1 Tax=Plant associated genomovirus 2 TaxID=2584391 RepID=A0A4Y5QCA7_9VIRU|nr:capsid protein [Plant associated genomovirus 2]